MTAGKDSAAQRRSTRRYVYRSVVTKFNISRINTDFGIFRILGVWSKESLDSFTVDISSIEIMSTDGWFLLNKSSHKIANLIADLIPTLQVHLQADNS